MKKEQAKPTYYAVINAKVRYDNRLTANAKLLYGEITCLTYKEGYCFAQNKYFAKLYNVSKTSISKWISQLVKYGYITVTLEYEQDSKEIKERKICIIPVEEKFNTPSQQKLKTPIEKNSKDNKTRNNNINIYKEFSFCDERFIKLWESEYIPLKKRKRASLTERAIRNNLNTLKKLSQNDNDIAYAILEQTLDNGWTSFYALKNQDKTGRYIKKEINNFKF